MTELELEMKTEVEAEEFAGELSDEALDRLQTEGALSGGCTGPGPGNKR